MADSLVILHCIFTKEQMALRKVRRQLCWYRSSVIVDKDGLLTVVEPFEVLLPLKLALNKDKIIKVDGVDIYTIRDENMV